MSSTKHVVTCWIFLNSFRELILLLFLIKNSANAEIFRTSRAISHNLISPPSPHSLIHHPHSPHHPAPPRNVIFATSLLVMLSLSPCDVTSCNLIPLFLSPRNHPLCPVTLPPCDIIPLLLSRNVVSLSLLLVSSPSSPLGALELERPIFITYIKIYFIL